MSCEFTVDISSSVVTIRVKGRFSFDTRSQFRAAYGQCLPGHSQDRRLVLDLAGMEFIDSSALGMLLVLREDMYSGIDEAKIEIINARPEILKILKMAKFNTLFKIM